MAETSISSGFVRDTGSGRPGASCPITVRFERIGPVDEAQLTLGDLTIIAGRNNTGKTYLAYTLYGLLKHWGSPLSDSDSVLRRFEQSHSRRPEELLPELKTLAESVLKTGHAKCRVDPAALKGARQIVLDILSAEFSARLGPSVFNSSERAFEGARVTVELGNDSPLEHGTSREATAAGLVSFEYDGTQLSVSWKTSRGASTELSEVVRVLAGQYMGFLLASLPRPFILSAERFGITLFYKELDFTRSQLVDLLQQLGEERGHNGILPFLMIDKSTSRYALPIKDNIKYARSLSELQEMYGLLRDHRLFDGIDEIMGGCYRASEDAIRFKSKARNERAFDLPLHLASSSARGLVDLYFYLKHAATPYDLLLIDEPESHLDTKNQILLARMLARMARAGVRVLITTHSDYLIKEINNLIMLHGLPQEEFHELHRLGYTSDDALDRTAVRAYVAQKHGLTECEVDRYGIDMPVFDDTIDGINHVSNELAVRVSAGGSSGQ